MIYLDSSALLMLVVERPHTSAQRGFLQHAHEKTSTATIGFVETVRTCERVGRYPNLMSRLLHDHAEIPVTTRVRDAAANLPGRIRSVDAIHLASAEQLGGDLTAFVTYDRRLAEAARNAGLPVETPGMR